MSFSQGVLAGQAIRRNWDEREHNAELRELELELQELRVASLRLDHQNAEQVALLDAQLAPLRARLEEATLNAQTFAERQDLKAMQIGVALNEGYIHGGVEGMQEVWRSHPLMADGTDTEIVQTDDGGLALAVVDEETGEQELVDGTHSANPEDFAARVMWTTTSKAATREVANDVDSKALETAIGAMADIYETHGNTEEAQNMVNDIFLKSGLVEAVPQIAGGDSGWGGAKVGDEDGDGEMDDPDDPQGAVTGAGPRIKTGAKPAPRPGAKPRGGAVTGADKPGKPGKPASSPGAVAGDKGRGSMVTTSDVRSAAREDAEKRAERSAAKPAGKPRSRTDAANQDDPERTEQTRRVLRRQRRDAKPPRDRRGGPT